MRDLRHLDERGRNGFVSGRAKLRLLNRAVMAIQREPVAASGILPDHGDIRLAVAIIIGWNSFISRSSELNRAELVIRALRLPR
ncbi:MAG TPA: hypothetical protein VGC91_17850 [Pyrinomonadaceae bacterium]